MYFVFIVGNLLEEERVVPLKLGKEFSTEIIFSCRCWSPDQQQLRRLTGIRVASEILSASPPLLASSFLKISEYKLRIRSARRRSWSAQLYLAFIFGLR
jgi:hypothetical protein